MDIANVQLALIDDCVKKHMAAIEKDIAVIGWGGDRITVVLRLSTLELSHKMYTNEPVEDMPKLVEILQHHINEESDNAS